MSCVTEPTREEHSIHPKFRQRWAPGPPARRRLGCVSSVGAKVGPLHPAFSKTLRGGGGGGGGRGGREEPRGTLGDWVQEFARLHFGAPGVA